MGALMRRRLTIKGAIALFVALHFGTIACADELSDKIAVAVSELGDQNLDRGIDLFEAMTKEFSTSIVEDDLARIVSSEDDITRICNAAIESIDVGALSEPTSVFWTCPDGMVREWLGDEAFEALNPKRVKVVAPRLPKKLIGRNGYADLIFTVSERGKVEDIRVLSSTHKDYEKIAKRVAKSALYEPATFNGRPFPREDVTWRISFNTVPDGD
jgi:TonB family protein